ncbi:MAG TPA: FAD-binding oxidoreductase [Longimicrobiales bacterium]|nr:FAD-binding oxidoreductase [Longimicrobiales bacterium]
MRSRRTTLSGWGAWPRAESDVYRPERLRDLDAVLRTDGTLLARGLGRSYGDAALNGAGATVLLERLDRVIAFDDETGTLTAEAGMSLADVLRTFAPRGWFPPVVPGTRHVTLGGALACDIHGKNHHRHGSIGRHVVRFTLLLASGERIVCSRTENPDAFRATLGGMGLTGIIVDVTLRLAPLPGRRVLVDYQRTRDLEEALAQFAADDDAYEYSVAWIDCIARGAALGRSVLMRGNWDTSPPPDAPAHPAGTAPPMRALPPAAERDLTRSPLLGVPPFAPGFLLRPSLLRLFNEVYYRQARTAARVPTAIGAFFFPLDAIADWNRLYGRAGFTQYQLVLPHPHGEDGVRRVLHEIARAGSASFLAVLKRFGPGEPGQLLSFPRAGYTLAVDFPLRDSGVLPLLDRLDAICIEHGGRVYLAKDARLPATTLPAMYPELDEWRAIREQLDPAGRFTSDQARRLRLA